MTVQLAFALNDQGVLTGLDDAKAKMAELDAQTAESTGIQGEHAAAVAQVGWAFRQQIAEAANLTKQYISMTAANRQLNQWSRGLAVTHSDAAMSFALTEAAGKRLVSQVLGVGSAVVGATLAWKGYTALLGSTGKGELKLSADATWEQVRAFKAIEEGARRAGLSLEDYTARQDEVKRAQMESVLALREQETNLSRVSDSFADLGSRAGDIRLIGEGINEWWNSTNLFADLWKKVDESVTQGTTNMIQNNQLLGDAIDEVQASYSRFLGWEDETAERIQQLREMREETERLTEAQRDQQMILREMRNIEDSVAEQIRLQRELGAITDARTKDELESQRLLLLTWKQDRVAAHEWGTKEAEEFSAKLTAISQQQLALEKEDLQKHADYWRRWREGVAREREEDERKAYERSQKLREEEIRRREEQARLEDQIADARRSFETDARNALLKEMELRAELKDEMTSAHELRMQQIRNETDAAIESADTEVEKRQAAIEGERRLRDAASAERMRQIQAEHQAEMDRLAREMEARRAAEEERRRMTEEARAAIEGAGVPQQVQQQFSQRQVFDEVVRRRQEEARRQFFEANRERIMQASGREGNLGEEERRRMEAQIMRDFRQQQQQIRRTAFREAQTGGIGQGEVQRAQADLFGNFARQQEASGKLDQANIDALNTIGQRLQEEAAKKMEHEQRIRAIENAIRASGERTRAQRGGLRG